MADFSSFATGFVSRINQQQKDRLDSKREIEQARRAAGIKAYQADVASYKQAAQDRAPIEQMIQAGQGNAILSQLSKGRTKAEIDNLTGIIKEAQTTGNMEELMSVIDATYAVPSKPDPNDTKYSMRGRRSGSRLVDERSPYADHPIARLLGLTGNRHKDAVIRRGFSTPTAEEKPEQAPLSFRELPEEGEEASKNPITLFFPNGQTMTARADDPKIDQALAQGATTEKPMQPLKATMLTPNEMRSVRGTLSALEDEPGPYKDFMKKYDEADTGAGDEREQIINEIYQEVSALRADRRYRDIDLGTLTTIAINRVNPRIKVESSWGGFAQDVTIESRNEYPILTPEEYQAAPSGTKFTTIDGRVGTKP